MNILYIILLLLGGCATEPASNCISECMNSGGSAYINHGRFTWAEQNGYASTKAGEG